MLLPEIAGIYIDHFRLTVHQHVQLHLETCHLGGVIHVHAHLVSLEEKEAALGPQDHGVVLLYGQLPGYPRKHDLAAAAPASMHRRADLADPEREVRFGHCRVNPERSPARRDAAISQAAFVGRVVDDSPHPVHQFVAEVVIDEGIPVHAASVNQGYVLVRNAETVQVVEQDKTHAVLHAEHLVGDAVAGHDGDLVPRLRPLRERGTTDRMLQRVDDRAGKVGHGWKISHLNFGADILRGNLQHALSFTVLDPVGLYRRHRRHLVNFLEISWRVGHAAPELVRASVHGSIRRGRK